MKRQRQKRPGDDRFYELRQRFDMPPDLARRVAREQLDLSDALKKMKLREECEQAVARRLVLPGDVRRIENGEFDLEEALFRQRVRLLKRAPAYMESALHDFASGDCDIVFATLGGGLLQGRILEPGTFTMRIFDKGDEVERSVEKHNVKLFFRASDRKKVLKRVINWGDESTRLQEGTLARPRDRRDVKARVLLTFAEADRVVTWDTIEGDRLRGRIRRIGRYEVDLETSQGPVVHLMRHAFGAIS